MNQAEELLKVIVRRAIEAESIPVPPIWKERIVELCVRVVHKLIGCDRAVVALCAEFVKTQQPAESKALEFAEYMAKGAEQFLESVNRYCKATTEITEESEVDDATEAMTEFARGLRNDIYEFRKRVPKTNLEKGST